MNKSARFSLSMNDIKQTIIYFISIGAIWILANTTQITDFLVNQGFEETTITIIIAILGIIAKKFVQEK